MHIDSLIKHDRYVESLCVTLTPHYDILLRHIPLYSQKRQQRNKPRLVGEIDVMAIKGEFCDIYEVKCSHRIIKAERQLNKIRKLVKERKVRDTFFFCGESGTIEKIQ